MARTIQNKRASGRGAPPEVYLPFSSFIDESDEDYVEVWQETIDLFSAVACMIAIAFFLTFCWSVVAALLQLPD